jgi:hypothetical protein
MFCTATLLHQVEATMMEEEEAAASVWRKV